MTIILDNIVLDWAHGSQGFPAGIIELVLKGPLIRILSLASMKFSVLTLLFKNLLKNYNDESVEVFSLKSNALSSLMLEYEYCSFAYPSLLVEQYQYITVST